MRASDLGLASPAHDADQDIIDPKVSDPTVGISTVVGMQDGTGGGASATASAGGGSGGVSASSLLGPAEDVVHVTIVEGCDCAFCVDKFDDHGGFKGGGDPAGVDPTGANPETGNIGQLLTIGQNPDGSYFFSGNRNVDATLIGVKWGSQDLTFSFPTSGTNYNGIGFDTNGVSAYHIDLGTYQQAAARDGFAQIAAATGLTFTEIAETDAVHANIRISQSADLDVTSAYGGFPSDTRGVAGDSWFGRTSQPYYDLAVKGTWGYSTMLHEIGHTMGLKHGHQDYTNSDLSFFFGTTPRFGSQSLTPDRDGQAWSLMTYTPAPGTGGFAGEKINQPQTFMQYDLAALQYMYGANYTTNAGDSTYTFSQTTGEMFIDGIGQGTPSGNKIFLTIWDGDGNDTIDVSNYATGVTIDLRPGEFSTVDQAQLANTLAFQNLTALAPGNFAMSLLYNNDARSLIENATGGVGNDIFVGNVANNVLSGGLGSDTVIFTGSTGIAVTLNDTGADVIVAHDGETDTLRSIENIVGTVGDDTLIGNSQNNMLVGGLGGTDVLMGNGGDDQLIGGGFTVTNNAIVTKAGSTANLDIATAIDPQASNSYTLLSDANIANSTTTPHATINATAAGGGLEYYRVDATAGATAIFDIDFSSIDTWIELVDSMGTVLASNDDNGADPGSSTTNSLINFTFATAGTYYIRVGRWTQPADTVAQPLAAGTTYTLHISLSSATVNAAPLSAVNTSSATLNGGEGDDFLQGTVGNDKFRGGTGDDTASFVTAFSNSATGVTVNLNLSGAQNTGAAGFDSLSGIENLIGSQYNDTLTGDANANVIEGGAGNDAIVGGAGDDTASYAGATAGVTVSLALQGGAQNTVGAGSDTLSGFQNLLGSALNDSLTGDALENVLTGGAGDDILNPGANAAGTADLLDGGSGSDTASFAGYAAAVTATLSSDPEFDGTATVGGLQIAALRNIENLAGTDLNDVLTGNADANAIDGGLGDDMLDGGDGVDTVRFTGSTAVTINLATTTAQNTGWGSDTIVNFENVRTGSGADNVTGDGNDNIFFEGGGADTYNGAGGADTLDYSASTSTVTVNLNTLTAQNTGTFGGSDTITNIENVVGAATFNNTLTGNTAANRFTGGSGVDTVQGNNGNDTIFGGAANDILLGGTSGALDDASADTIEGGAGSDFLSGGQGNDILRGGDGDDTMVGGVGNTIGQFFTGVDAGNDTYDGGNGTDIAIMVYDGRLGNGASTVGIAFDIGSLEGNSNITFDGVVVGSLTSVERTTFRGTTVDDTVRGGGTLDSLTGFAGNDVLDGWFGNDLISGGLGDDTLIGGAGLDTVTYVNSLAGVTVDLRLEGVAQNTGGEGTDTLSGFEYLVGSAFGDTLRGTDDFNLIIDSGIGAGATALSQTDSIFGYGGNDTIHVTRAAGGVATNINLDGGTGDDFIELRSGTLTGFTLATSFAGLSASTTGGSLTYAPLGATSADRNVDVVTVDGGDGNDRIVLTGVASAVVNAGSGADIVSISMRGVTTVNNYQITLGTGADVIQFGVGSSSGTSADVAATARTNRVTDFAVGNSGDRFEMSNFLNLGLTGYTANSNAFASGHLRLVQSGSDLLLQADRDGAGVTNSFVTIFAISNGYTGGFTTFNFDGFIGDLTLTGIGALDETITGANGNDTLSGGDGNDILSGLDGNDYLDGGAGADAMSGGTGNDTYVVDDFGDTVSEAGGSGIDTVRSSISFVLAADFENLVLTGTARRGTGNDLDNVITGNASNNNIDGGAGNDTISGGAGNDRLTGGSGVDTFIFATGTGLDGVMDFVSGTDKLDLAALFSSFAQVQANTTNDVNGNAIINLGGGNSVTLFGLAAEQLQSGDVIVGAPAQAALKMASDAQIGIGNDVDDLALGYAPDDLSVYGSVGSLLVFEYMG
jgi:Ca2+-binding RTX toxin-like protein